MSTDDSTGPGDGRDGRARPQGGTDARPVDPDRAPDSFGIAVPETWTSYDLDGDALAPVRAEMLRNAPRKTERDLINATFRDARRILATARRHGALYAAGTTTMYEDGLLMAGVMIFSLTQPQGESFSARDLARQFSATGGRRTHSGVERRFTTVELPGVGRVGRLTGVERGDLAHGVSYKMLVMHTVVPVPGSRRVLVITCHSPNLPLAEQLYDVFDAITGTFTFEYAAQGEPSAVGG
ncbi:hypothetical protein [Streptomyces sp. NPDC048057]|uniref:hypothetical protein n=1 Tax=Streptomyces sp. NPDC048057 TaxID=3155628 RepID=UPI0033F7817B